MTRTLAHSTLVTVLFASGLALAQEGTYQEGFHPKMGLAMLSWEIGAPVGSLHSWEGNVTPSGGAFEVRSCVAKQLSLGVATNWNWFNQNINSVTETQNNITFNGPIYRRLKTRSSRTPGSASAGSGRAPTSSLPPSLARPTASGSPSILRSARCIECPLASRST